MNKEFKDHLTGNMTEQPAPSSGVMTDNWKVGDAFILPGNPHYKDAYIITRLSREKFFNGVRYWAYFPEEQCELHSGAENMIRASKLHKALM